MNRFIYFKLLKWKLEGKIAPELKKCIVAVVPHTSWHDFYMAILVRSVLGVKINFVAKKELFKFPFGWFFRFFGGAPLDRTSGQNKVSAMAKIFKEKEEFRLALSPEGTRKKVDTWKTGFYYIAKEANVPIVLVALDFGSKTIRFSEPFNPTNDKEADFAFMKSYFKGAVGKVPEYT